MTPDQIDEQRKKFEKLMRKEGDVTRDIAGSYSNPRVWTAWRFWLLSIEANKPAEPKYKPAQDEIKNLRELTGKPSSVCRDALIRTKGEMHLAVLHASI